MEENKRKLSQDLEKNQRIKFNLRFRDPAITKTKIELEEYLLSIENPDAIVNKIKITDGFERKLEEFSMILKFLHLKR
ncbi:MAG: hypothetical protein CM15mP111_3310 [Hyphomicrobiales bacterium]|nr:MAG: hypothetical protein CM15mP111_3310 [Hyphomicrobiales bacterium]